MYKVNLISPTCIFSIYPTGGADATLKAHSENRLLPMINPSTAEYDYDLVVIGGGSGGLAAGKVGLILPNIVRDYS